MQNQVDNVIKIYYHEAFRGVKKLFTTEHISAIIIFIKQ